MASAPGPSSRLNRLRLLSSHVAAPAQQRCGDRRRRGRPDGVSSSECGAAASAAKAVLGVGGAALAGHVAYEARKHGLAESWRKSLERKGSAFALTEAGWWLGKWSGLLHFSAVWKQKRMSAAPGAVEAEVATEVWDMHGWFYETTGELNDPEKKQLGTAHTYKKMKEASAAAEGEDGPAPPPDAALLSSYTLADVTEHTSADDCWLTISGKVYDVTDWLPTHPGGPSIVLKHAGAIFYRFSLDFGLIFGPILV